MIALLASLSAYALTATDYVMVSHNGIDARAFDNANASNGTDQLTLYDRGFGTSLNPNGFRILASLNDDRIIAVRPYNTTGAFQIPVDGWVIAANGTQLPMLQPSLYAAGDPLRVRPADTCRGEGVPVLLFHDLGSTSTNFETALQAIAADGYNTITLAQLDDWMNGAGSLPVNPLLITFDDGYASHFSFGASLLNTYGMVGTFFIITSFPGTASWASWATINTAHTAYPANVELGRHSHAAHVLIGGTTGKYLTMTEPERQADLASCIAALQSHTGVTPTAIAWPYGDHDDALIQDAKDAGFSLMFSTWPGLNTPGNSGGPGNMRRFGANVANPWSTVSLEMNAWTVCEE